MASDRVKHKFPFSIGLAGLAGVTLLLSWLGAFPRNWIENHYARSVFPTISHIAGAVSDAVPFSLLDIAIALGIGILIYTIWRRRGWFLLGAASAAYLWFFWSWGLNYHRPGLDVTLDLAGRSVSAE